MSHAPARRRFAVEVIQTSGMDCGPAALKCLLEGFGVPVSYGRLREACQTDVDGTSIDTLEDIAVSLGLDAEQVMLPVDHLLLTEAAAVPAIAVVLTPGGMTHFVVLWGARAGWVQLMDPGTGRGYVRDAAFLRRVFIHRKPVPAEGFREWAGSDDFLAPLRRRMRDLGLAPDHEAWILEALADDGWRPIARLDAAVRMLAALIAAGGLRRGLEARRLLAQLLRDTRDLDDAALHEHIPANYFVATPTADPDEVLFQGAVLLRVRGLKSAVQRDPLALARSGLSPDLVAALTDPPRAPLRELLQLLRGPQGDQGVGRLAAVLALGSVAGAAAVLVEAVILRGLFDVGARLGLGEQRLGAAVTVLAFLLLVLALELPLALALRRLGRHLDGRLRIAFVTAIPRLGDRYLASRPVSDMADRIHTGHALRGLPLVLGRLVRTLAELIFTALALVWLAPASALWVALAVVGVLVAPVVMQAALAERDLRVRSHGGALGHFYLDALLGLAAIRTHGAERSLRREHEALLVEWSRSFRAFARLQVVATGLSATVGLGLAVLLFSSYLGQSSEPAGALLLVYWALALPAIGERFAGAAFELPGLRNTALRLMEPLQAPGADVPLLATAAPLTGTGGVHLQFSKVEVVAGGHTILRDLDLELHPGQHVAVVGPSGAGKSSFIGVLLGWHRPHQGNVTVDGRPLDPDTLAALRDVTAWVDPAVQLWNGSLLDNLRYGNPDAVHLGAALERADLGSVLARLPDGLQTCLGEGGALVSGGEGQRVRLARALLRPTPRLVLLDEALRGLDRAAREDLLARARELWRESTLLCVTHDIAAALRFPRVLVVEGGRVVEDGDPKQLAARPGTRLRAMIDDEHDLDATGWGDVAWRRLRLERGALHEESARTCPPEHVLEASP
jgi:ATP-binding cassette subfamily B protein